MTTKIRASKYRHLFGKDEQQRNCFNNVNVGSPAPDADLIRANGRYFAVPWATPGTLCVVPLATPGAVDRDNLPLIVQDDEASVNAFAFHPFDDHLVATATQDAKAHLWRFPEGGLTEDITTPVQTFAGGHATRLVLIDFHPLAEGVLVTVGADKTVRLWDVESAGERVVLTDHRDQITSLTWNPDGSQLATFCKDKKQRIFDPRGKAVVSEVAAHEGTKGGRVQWLGPLGQILTTGFTRQSEREVRVWDPRSLAQPLVTQKLDVSPAMLLPVYDADTGVLFLSGKGDGLMRTFELTDSAPFLNPLVEYKSNKPAAGITCVPKHGLNVKECEIARFYKLSGREVIPISFMVPRLNKDFFQDDLFPDTWDGQPAYTADSWFGGASGNSGNKVSLKPADMD